MTLPELKQQIWDKCKQSLANVEAAAMTAKVDLPLTTVADAQRLLDSFKEKKRKPPRPKLPTEINERYKLAYHKFQADNFPHWVADGHTLDPDMPNTATANGLTDFICKFLFWSGWRATRINVEGRIIDGKRIKSSTRTGSADVSSTIKGRTVMWEVKIGNDRPSPAQLKEQALERKAGGEYFFVKTVQEFFNFYDSIL